MVLLISEELDPTTNIVVSWLQYFETNFKRINNFYEFNFSPEISVSNNTTDSYFLDNINVKDFKSAWFRRTPDVNHSSNVGSKEADKQELTNEINSLLVKKNMASYSSMFSFLDCNTFIGNPFSSSVNKLDQLRVAKEVGLKIPDTLLTGQKESLINFIEQHKSVITKPLTSITAFKVSDKSYTTHTKLVDEELINSLPQEFTTSLFQKNIKKQFEIRTFFLNGECYSMAIFSQENPLTQIDFRVNDVKNPNRNTPFKLPKEIESKVCQLMQALELNTGSLDFIYSEDGEIIYLEVNPVGQFGMVSMPCNYYLEKKVAQTLSK